MARPNSQPKPCACPRRNSLQRGVRVGVVPADRGGVLNGRALWALGESLKHDPHSPLAPQIEEAFSLGVKRWSRA